MIRFVLIAVALCVATPAGSRAGDGIISSAFDISSRQYAIERGIPARLVAHESQTTTVALEEAPTSRWDPTWGSYPTFVADVLYTLGDSNAEYVGQGRVRVSYGPRKVLVDTLQRFSAELENRGLRLQLHMLSRDLSSNGNVRGDANSDHLIGLAADGRVVLATCGKALMCDARNYLAQNPLEVQLRIILAATAAGAQQINMYGAFQSGQGQWIHIGVSPFRNGGPGELLGSARADGTRRIGYGSAQKGSVGALSAQARGYIGSDGTRMEVAFRKLLHNAPPLGYEAIYNAIRDRNLDWIGDVMD